MFVIQKKILFLIKKKLININEEQFLEQNIL